MTTVLSLWKGVIELTPPRPRMIDLIDVVALEYQVLTEDLKGRCRHRELVRPRHDFMHRAREAGFSLTQIGNFLGRDHTTIIHGSRCHARRVGAVTA